MGKGPSGRCQMWLWGNHHFSLLRLSQAESSILLVMQVSMEQRGACDSLEDLAYREKELVCYYARLEHEGRCDSMSNI